MTTEQTRDRVEGRILEAKTDAGGTRVFRVRLISYGDSKNGRRYPEAVLRAASGLYNGAKAYDHHRTAEEMATGTIAGLVGTYRNVEAGTEGIEADLHLLPSAVQTAEALDASLAAQQEGLPPLVGLSHDVMATWRPIVDGGKRLSEATGIVSVNSTDIVAEPAAGGQAVRMVANDDGTGPDELLHDRTTARGLAVVAQEAAARNLPRDVVDKLTAALPERFSETQLKAVIDAVFSAVSAAERNGLAPTIQVTQESMDKKAKALDAFFSIDGTTGGYRTLREAYIDITGHRPSFLGEDLNRRILRDSYGAGFDSSVRSAESMDSSSWAQILGDSVTRRMVAEYGGQTWQDWRKIVSAVSFGLDFRTQRRDRFGGYGLLPAVNQGAPYQPLTSPDDEEATYAITKRGGTEDITLEMIANDDVDALRRIPTRLGRSAAMTLYRFVFDTFTANAATTYDGVTLFHTDHANTDTNPLSQSGLSTGRRRMRKQAAYGNATDVLSIVPRYILVPSELEELAFQLCTSTVAVPATPAGPSDTPNIHRGLEPIVVDYYTDANDWFLVADPRQIPTIELGFYSNSDTPELFTQSDQNSGSMFNADKLTMKIRHIYSGTVVDHRAFYRGANA